MIEVNQPIHNVARAKRKRIGESKRAGDQLCGLIDEKRRVVCMVGYVVVVVEECVIIRT